MAEILIGTLMIAGTLAFHALGSARWLRFVGVWHQTKEDARSIFHLFTAILATGVVLLVLHVVETILWAVLFWNLPEHGGLESFHQTVYFSMVTFTSLGYGDITLAPEWQILGPMEAMVGITVFGITTALLFAVIQKSWRIHLGKLP